MRIAIAALLAAAGMVGCATEGKNCADRADGDRWCQSCGATVLAGVRCNDGKAEAFTYCASNDQYCRYLPLNQSGGEYTPVP